MNPLPVYKKTAIETRWLKRGLGDQYTQAREAYCKHSALGATLTAEEVAAAVVGLLESKKITGQLLTIDAGRTIGTEPKTCRPLGAASTATPSLPALCQHHVTRPKEVSLIASCWYY